MENEAAKNEVVASEAARYTLLPGENVLLELKVKSFGDDGSNEINIVANSSKTPFAFIGKFISKIKNLFTCCCSKKTEENSVVESGFFVVTSHRCFISKDYVEKAAAAKKSAFIPLLVIGAIPAIIGLVVLLDSAFDRHPSTAGIIFGLFLLIIGGIFILFAFISKNKKQAQFLREEHEFSSFPRSVLTEYNSFSCNKELLGGLKTGCCGSAVAASAYKTVLTVGLNTKGENSSIEPEKTMDLVLDPEQVSNHEQALAIVSKLAELAQKAN